MNIHISGIGDTTWLSVEHPYIDQDGTLTVEHLQARKEHNQAMLEIASTISYSRYEDVMGCANAKLIWDFELVTIYGGDTNVNKAKAKSLRGNFDDMRMLENENISQYCTRVKDVVNAIRGFVGIIEGETMVRKVLRTLLPKYVFRVSTM